MGDPDSQNCFHVNSGDNVFYSQTKHVSETGYPRNVRDPDDSINPEGTGSGEQFCDVQGSGDLGEQIDLEQDDKYETSELPVVVVGKEVDEAENKGMNEVCRSNFDNVVVGRDIADNEFDRGYRGVREEGNHEDDLNVIDLGNDDEDLDGDDLDAENSDDLRSDKRENIDENEREKGKGIIQENQKRKRKSVLDVTKPTPILPLARVRRIMRRFIISRFCFLPTDFSDPEVQILRSDSVVLATKAAVYLFIIFSKIIFFSKDLFVEYLTKKSYQITQRRFFNFQHKEL